MSKEWAIEELEYLAALSELRRWVDGASRGTVS